MSTNSGFHRWQTEHRVVFRDQLEPASSWGDSVAAVALLPIAIYILVQVMMRLFG